MKIQQFEVVALTFDDGEQEPISMVMTEDRAKEYLIQTEAVQGAKGENIELLIHPDVSIDGEGLDITSISAKALRRFDVYIESNFQI